MNIHDGKDKGSGHPPPHEKSQIYRVSLQYWSGIPENHKATKQAFNVGHYRTASKTPFHFSGFWSLSILKKCYQNWTPYQAMTKFKIFWISP